MEKKQEAHRWTTAATEYVDIDTGEIISKKLAMRDYDIIKTTKRIEYGNYSNTIQYTRIAQRKRQQRLNL